MGEDEKGIDLERLLVQWRRQLHQQPELSRQERETSRFIIGELRKMGIEIQTFQDHYGVCATIRGKLAGPIVVFRADMDALPVTELNEVEYKSQHHGVMHACGHDAHMAMALGVAKWFSDRRDSLAGVIKVIFQPAEEAAPIGGADLMIKEGVLAGAKAIFGMHVWPDLPCGMIGIRKGALMAASDRLTINLFGHGAHAGQPHHGVDAIMMSADVLQGIGHIVSRQIDPLETATISIGCIRGGDRYNVIAREVVLEGTVRTLGETVRKELPDKLERMVGGIAASHGGSYKVSYQHGYPVLNNWSDPVDIVIDVATGIIGRDNVNQAIKPALTAEDFSKYLLQLPGAFFWLGCGSANGDDCVLHSPNFDIDESALLVGVKIMCSSGLVALERYKHA